MAQMKAMFVFVCKYFPRVLLFCHVSQAHMFCILVKRTEIHGRRAHSSAASLGNSHTHRHQHKQTVGHHTTRDKQLRKSNIAG